MNTVILPADSGTLLPEGPGQRRFWRGLPGAADMLAILELARNHPQPVVVVTAKAEGTVRWQRGLKFLQTLTQDDSGEPLPCLEFPDWETLPYDTFSPHQDIISERLKTLKRLGQFTEGILTVPVTTLLQKLSPPSYIQGSCLNLSRGDTFNVMTQRMQLEAAGYQSMETVSERGQYAVRGALMDIFPMGATLPVRVDLFDDEIDTLRTFDPDTQRTVEQIDSIDILPAKEFPFDDDAIARFRDCWHGLFQGDVRRCSVYQDVSSFIAPNGIEYYLPLFFDRLATLFEHLPENPIFVLEGHVEAAATSFLREVGERYESLRHDVERPIVAPESLYLTADALQGALKAAPRIILSDASERHNHDFFGKLLPNLTINHQLQEPALALRAFTEGHPAQILFCAESAGRREIFDELLTKAGIVTRHVQHLTDLQSSDQHGICIAPLESGFQFPGLTLITEGDVLGRQTAPSKRSSTRRLIDPEQIVRNLTELNMGAPVVHVEHGVGRYLGLQTLAIDDADHEFLTLGYAGGAKLYVPVTSLHLIGRYAGADEEHAPLHRLGSDQWERAKKKAAEKIVDVAAELLDIYARRASRKSHCLTADQAEYATFAAEFPFITTPDQDAAIETTLADLAQPQAMDRLVCGDVGFGKTEVAMRAAFVTVQSQKQVVLLVPTTLLAQQHFDTLRDRFASWPVSIDITSRLRSNAEIEEIKQKCKNGKLDILIGTHKLLSGDLSFKDLGLVIIDEEHRFGVRQKEKLRAMRAEVDVLTLTATPIPRTLNLSLSGIRDLSIIATPPARRLSIKTFVQEKRSQTIREAISRELMRGGQVFFLHNEVKSIYEAADAIQELVPEARIGVGHGQMRSNDLERVMSEFYHRQLNVLVCTTIIETGIDIPNANTIIIERADKFGLAQLHQLRGRVGRSHRQAYAYLLTPGSRSMTADAVKRLEAIEASGELGVGFTLATQDMEIRGAGELLGDDQSGQIESIGFSLYVEMLDRAVDALRSGKVPDQDAPLETVSQEVNLHTPTLIPEDYLPDVHSRLILYKRIAGAKEQQELDALRVEVIDRFGLLPDALKNLFSVTALKLMAQSLGIIRLDLGELKGKLEFSKTTIVEPIRVVNLVQQQSSTYRLDGASILRIDTELPTFDARLDFAHALFDLLAPKQSHAA